MPSLAQWSCIYSCDIRKLESPAAEIYCDTWEYLKLEHNQNRKKESKLKPKERGNTVCHADNKGKKYLNLIQ